MIKAVLFDMDETLLDINLIAFVMTYQKLTCRLISQISGKPSLSLALPFIKAYLALEKQNRSDNLTNEELFDQVFYKQTNIPLFDPVIKEAITYFEREVLPSYNSRAIGARPARGALDTLQVAQKLGLKLVLATNPSFSEACISCRMKWAEIDQVPFSHITVMENSYRLKPSQQYFSETCAAIGLSPDECLMVGNDAKRDIAQGDFGLRTLYIGKGTPKRAFWSGSMQALSQDLPFLVEELNSL